MSYEYAPESDYQRTALGPIKRFRADLGRVGLHYLDTRMSLQKYLADEFEMLENQSDIYICRLEQEGVLPRPRLYDGNSVAALEQHRQAMYSHWMPLYRDVYDDADLFRLWVPQALRVAVPPEGPHGAECRQVESGVRGEIGSLACRISLSCPVNVIAETILLSPPFLPVRLEDYEFFDAKRAQDDAMSLIEAAAARQIITPQEMRRAASESRDSYGYYIE